MIDSTINSTGYYAIGSNATPVESKGIKINIEGSDITVKAEGGDDAAILFNVIGTVNIKNSTITGDRQALILRGSGDGNIHTLENTKIIATGNNSIEKEYLEGDWGTGNEVPLAALVIGDRHPSYPYSTTVKLDNVTVEAQKDTNNSTKSYYGIYVYQDENYPVEVTGTATIKASTKYNTDTNAKYAVDEVEDPSTGDIPTVNTNEGSLAEVAELMGTTNELAAYSIYQGALSAVDDEISLAVMNPPKTVTLQGDEYSSSGEGGNYPTSIKSWGTVNIAADLNCTIDLISELTISAQSFVFDIEGTLSIGETEGGTLMFTGFEVEIPSN